MNKRNDLKNQASQWIMLFLISLTLFLSALFWSQNFHFVFVAIFALLYWQQEKIRSATLILNKLHPLVSFLLLGLLWAFVFEVTLQRRNFFITLGFYLPYFLVWYKIFRSRAVSLMQTFYLSGFSGVLFQLLITKQIVPTFTQAPDVPTGLLFTILRIASVITLSGALTAFPFIVLGGEEKEGKPQLGMYLLGLFSYFIALIGYLVWAGVIKRLLI